MRTRYKRDDNFSLRHIVKRLERLLEQKVLFIDDFLQDRTMIDHAQKGSVILLENIRFYKGEMKNDEELGKSLASLCDIYVNDAFGTSHRKHSSTYAIAQYAEHKVAGFLLKREIEAFAKALFKPIKPICRWTR